MFYLCGSGYQNAPTSVYITLVSSHDLILFLELSSLCMCPFFSGREAQPQREGEDYCFPDYWCWMTTWTV